jgi:uncharacterized protein (TIRG00374 family)
MAQQISPAEADRRVVQRRYLINVLKFTVTAGGLLFVIVQFDLQAIGLALSALSSVNGLLWLTVSLALVLASLIVRAYRWLIIIRGAGLEVSFGRLVELYVVGNFFNAVLPSGFGGDVVRVVEMSQKMPAGIATGTVFIDRLAGLLALFTMALILLPFRPAGFPIELLLVVALTCGIGLAGGVALLHPATAGFMLRRLPAMSPKSARTFLDNLLQVIAGYRLQRVMAALGISVLFNLMLVGWWAAAARALGLAIPFDYLLLVIPILSIVLLLPSIGGLGVREALAPALFAAVPLSPEAAVALSLLVFAIERASSILGGPVYLYTTWRDGRHATSRRNTVLL